MAKYSPNLSKFLKKPRNKNYQRVYLKKLDNYNKPVSEWRSNLIYIGRLFDDGYLHGARLSSILCGDFDTWAFAVGNGVTDITDQFWMAYERDGRCVIDRSHAMHFQTSDDRYTVINNTRRCNWCGQWHVRHVEKLTKIERRDVWLVQEAA
jgi:hypothetical protein